MSFSKLVKFFPKLIIPLFKFLELLFPHVEVMHNFTYIVSSKNFLYDGGLICEIFEILLIDMCLLFLSEQFSCIVCSKLSLNFYSGSPLSQKFLALDIHFEFRLYFECRSVISSPLFFTFIRVQVVNFFQIGKQPVLLCNQFHD